MKKSQLEHLIRASSTIMGEKEFIVIGSQSLHGKYPDLADDILLSVEADIYAKKNLINSDYLNTIGQDSPFHEQFGYYADPADDKTAVLPKDWKNRLVHLKMASEDPALKAYCLDPSDLVVAKLAAGREKDTIFIQALLEKGLVKPEIIRLRIAQTKVAAERLAAMNALLSRIENKLNSTEQAITPDRTQGLFFENETENHQLASPRNKKNHK